jgi:hypothetical protein
MVVTGISAVQSQAVQGSVANGLTATGSTQGAALPLPADINYVTTVAASTGVILPPMNPGDSLNVYNKGANALLVYPPTGAIINSLATNAGYSVATATPYVEVYCITPLIYIASQSA